MARPALTRLAGTIAATAMCAAAATEAAAQDRTLVLNNQLQLGDVFAGQTLNVEDASDQITVSNAAQGNSLAGAVQNDSIVLRSTQVLRGDVRAVVDIVPGAETEGRLTVANQARGAYLAGGAYDADAHVDAVQSIEGGAIEARTRLDDADARLLAGAQIGTAAIGNTVALGGDNAAITGRIEQNGSGPVHASSLLVARYMPAPVDVSSQALVNATAASSYTGASNQELEVRQRSTGSAVVAATSVHSGNAWDLAGRAHAGANRAEFYNHGGSLIVTTDQSNSSLVGASATVTAYDYGAAVAQAHSAANAVVVGNNDIYVDIDNTQVNTGGVQAEASFVGMNGYDAYVGADAVGNAVTGYACSACRGQLNAVNTQINAGDVSAVAHTTVNGRGRAVLTGTSAVGNSATFYVSRPASD